MSSTRVGATPNEEDAMKALILMQSMGWDGKPEAEAKTTLEGQERDVRREMARVLREAREGGCAVRRLPTPGWKRGVAHRFGVNAGAGGLTEFVLVRYEEGAYMKLLTLIRVASDSYPDGAVLDAYKRGDAAGDTLALFIAWEIADTFEAGQTTAEQFERAIEVMDKAHREIGEVLSGLRRRLERDATPSKR